MRTHSIKIILSLTWLLALAGCTTTVKTPEQQPAAQTKPVAWESRAQTLSSISNWDLKGLIAIRQNKDAVSANWQWQQQANHNYSISLYGPLGSNSVQLTGSPNHVLLEMSDGKKFSAKSVEALVAQQSGWRLPVSNLYFWIRGLPVPGVAAKKQLDANQRITTMIQQGWRVEYLNYTSVNQIDLPSKMTLTNPDMSVKIVIKHWQL
jgi:outer membrane lipoprotein LolB